MAPLKILISGAGIAGPALALWLARIGSDITIVERDTTLRTNGQQVDLRGQGIVVMKKMGIESAVRAALCSEPGMRLINDKGGSKAFFPALASVSGSGSRGPTSEYEIMRGDLVRILYDATKDLKGVQYLFSSTIRSFSQDEPGVLGGKVHVTFSDGRTDDYDLLIGADGIGSVTRKLMLDPSVPDPIHDLGVHAAFYTAPSQEGDTNEWTFCHMPGGLTISTRKDSPDNIRVYLMARGGCAKLDAAERSGSREETKKAWAERYGSTEGSWGHRFIKDLMESKEADDLYSQHMNQVRLPEGAWSNGRVVLLGDAAYCPTPLGGGLGTTLALTGAYVLAGEVARRWKESEGVLKGAEGLAQASRDYEQIMRPLAGEAQKISPLILRLVMPASKFGIWGLHTLAGLFAAITSGKGSGLSTKEESEKLTLPNYPELFPREAEPGAGGSDGS